MTTTNTLELPVISTDFLVDDEFEKEEEEEEEIFSMEIEELISISQFSLTFVDDHDEIFLCNVRHGVQKFPRE